MADVSPILVGLRNAGRRKKEWRMFKNSLVDLLLSIFNRLMLKSPIIIAFLLPLIA